MFRKALDSSAEIHDLIASRWSGVSFDADRPVTDEQLQALMEAARWAPSCFGDQPWRYLVCRKDSHPQGWQKIYDSLTEKNQAWCQHVPLLIIACHDTEFSHNGNPNKYGPYDTGAASLSMCLQARALGLMSHQMGGFSADQIRDSFAVPDRFTPIAAIAIGYQLAEDKIPQEFKERELAPRKRNSLEDHFFLGAWKV